ncbi:MAG: radical SAM protein [Anaerocolumna sp.]
MNQEFNLGEYLSNGIENIIKGAVRASFKNPKESTFIARFALSGSKARKIRQKLEDTGEHIPPFLIASITNVCNLHCKGCYARANSSCTDHKDLNQMSTREWDRIFLEAGEIGISFILLAGGEPMMRMDVVKAAAKYKNIIFPVFTNGTMFDDTYLSLLDNNRNLIPILSIEGDSSTTDLRRGEGIYAKLMEDMKNMSQAGILYGASITVNKENIAEVTSDAFLTNLYNRGCKVVFYVEYVPVTRDTRNIAPTDTEREYLENRLLLLRKAFDDMIFISFPGDEKSSGGCLAAGRGFFHINASGFAEPCPFSPYSDTNLKNVSLKSALKSPLFQKLQSSNILMGEHQGGCVLFEQKELVETMIL